MKDLSENSKKVLEEINNFNENGEPCFIEDISEWTDLTFNQVKGHITDLRNKGYLAPLDPDCLELYTN